MMRQGDVLINKIDSLPEGVIPKGGLVLVYGESTGHAHRLEKGQVFEKNGALFFQVKGKTRLVHEEHKPITLDKGFYSVIQQREYIRADMTKVVVD